MTRRCWIALLGMTLAACGAETPSAAPDAGSTSACTTPSSARLLPLAVGSTWTYDVTDAAGGAPVAKTTTVEAFEDVGDRKAGTSAFRIRTEKTDGATVSWQADHCDAILRHREISYDLAGAATADQFYEPSKLRVDESAAHLTPGASWTVSYSEVTVDAATGALTTKTKSETWTVEATDAEVTVPAGTFRCTVLHKVGVADGQSDKRFWFAPGVGKIKEEGDQLEELVSYSL